MGLVLNVVFEIITHFCLFVMDSNQYKFIEKNLMKNSTNNSPVAKQVITNISKIQITQVPTLTPAHELTHDALAIELGEKGFYKNARYVHKFNKWYLWDGTRWQVDETRSHYSIIGKFLRGTANNLIVQVNKQKTILSDADFNQLENWANRQYKDLRSAPIRHNIEALIKSDPKCAVLPEIFDADLNIIGTPGGTIDLRTGQLLPARPNQYITKLTSVAPEAGTPKLWLKFLNETFAGDQALIGFIQRLCGYALTGLTKEEKLFFLYGTGANGKSKFLETIYYILGDYARRAPVSLFLEQKHQDHPTAMAGLKEARLVVGSELPSGRYWNEQVIKDLTGGDTIAARLMRQDFFYFKPQFSILIAGNHQPLLKNVDESIVRRMVMVPFAITVPEAKRDVNLGDKLKAESGKILNWCVEGSVQYFNHGLQIPQSVLNASAKYIRNVDVTSEFIDSKLVQDGNQSNFDDVYISYKDWMLLQGHSPFLTEKQLRKEFKNRSHSISRSNSKYILQGYSLI